MPIKGMRVADDSGDCCCCSDCGARSDVPGCCYCLCDTLCVTVKGPADTGTGSVCDCDTGKAILPWSTNNCSYSGEVVCSGLRIDLTFTVKKCGDTGTGTTSGTGTGERCYLCLSSTCLGLSGLCPTDCREFNEGCTEDIDNDCGNYQIDRNQSGGFDMTWAVDATNCDADIPTLLCDEGITVNVQCSPTTNPAGAGPGSVSGTGTGSDQGRRCMDCDCVCTCICMTYRESDCDDDDPHTPESFKICWNETDKRWRHTFGDNTGTSTSCPLEQTATITLERQADGCCLWRLSVSRGTVKDPIVKTECPTISHTWNIDVPDTGTGTGNDATITVICAFCDECGEAIGCCGGVLIPTVLTLSFIGFEHTGTGSDQGCSCLEDIMLELIFDPATTTDWTSIPRPPLRFPQFCDDGEATQGIWITLECSGTPGDPFDPTKWQIIFDPCNVNRGIISRPPVAGELVSCDPFKLLFPLSNMEDCCSQDPEGEEFVTIVVTE